MPSQKKNGDALLGDLDGENRTGVVAQELERFWKTLTLAERAKLLQVDKKQFFEHIRTKYCSRCYGLFVLCYDQCEADYRALKEGKCQLETVNRRWAGVAVNGDRDIVTCSKGAMQRQDLRIFDWDWQRMKQQALLHAVSDGLACCGYGWSRRIYGSKACSLHTRHCSCEVLTEYWNSMSEPMRTGLFTLPEQDFVEKLDRYLKAKICKDCRRNVSRAFKELKDLKRQKCETRCNSAFCCPDVGPGFTYEITRTTCSADWSGCVSESDGIKFEWALGSFPGGDDIVRYTIAEKATSFEATDLHLNGIGLCHLTIRSCLDQPKNICFQAKGKANAGYPSCVHQQLFVGNGMVWLDEGPNVIAHFDRAEEVQEIEDEDQPNGNSYYELPDSKRMHAETPELAREALIDAASVIFSERVQHAFREQCASENAHNLFVLTALSLLQERLWVGCRDVFAAALQAELLAEEEEERTKTSKSSKKKNKKGKKAKEQEAALASSSQDDTKAAASPASTSDGAEQHKREDETDARDATSQVEEEDDGPVYGATAASRFDALNWKEGNVEADKLSGKENTGKQVDGIGFHPYSTSVGDGEWVTTTSRKGRRRPVRNSSDSNLHSHTTSSPANHSAAVKYFTEQHQASVGSTTAMLQKVKVRDIVNGTGNNPNKIVIDARQSARPGPRTERAAPVDPQLAVAAAKTALAPSSSRSSTKSSAADQKLAQPQPQHNSVSRSSPTSDPLAPPTAGLVGVQDEMAGPAPLPSTGKISPPPGFGLHLPNNGVTQATPPQSAGSSTHHSPSSHSPPLQPYDQQLPSNREWNLPVMPGEWMDDGVPSHGGASSSVFDSRFSLFSFSASGASATHNAQHGQGFGGLSQSGYSLFGAPSANLNSNWDSQPWMGAERIGNQNAPSASWTPMRPEPAPSNSYVPDGATYDTNEDHVQRQGKAKYNLFGSAANVTMAV
mmetsp:Transcript_9815/g.35969  ORF Transcript_9815/g.35969 Transcript_9815/m.35969 type:complete len:955 (-) Transcript_9815:138-3002(-)